MNVKRWSSPSNLDDTVDEMLDAMKAEGVDERLRAAAKRYIYDPRQFASDQPLTLVSGMTPSPMTLCHVCSDEVDPNLAHTIEDDGKHYEVHTDCCDECKATE